MLNLNTSAQKFEVSKIMFLMEFIFLIEAE